MDKPTVTLLMTRPRAASERFVATLTAQLRAKLDICYSPLIDIKPVSQPIEFGDATGILFTSAHGVATAAAMDQRRDLPCFCVGQATTSAAQNTGWVAQCVGETADQMVAWALQAEPHRFLHLCGRHTRGDIAKKLTSAGIPTRAQVIYDQKLLALNEPALTRLQASSPVIAPIFSPRSARQFADQRVGRAPIYVVALSDAVAEPIRTTGIGTLYVVDHPTAEAMRLEVEKLMNRLCRVEGEQGAQ